MLKSLIRIALRTLRKDLGYSVLNILGLTIGITFSLFLFFYVLDELNYDRYNTKADRIFRIVSHIKESDNNSDWAITQYPLGPTLKKEYPEVEQAVRFVGSDRAMYQYGNLQFYETKIFVVDSNLFEVFTYPFIEGNPKTALVEPHSMVLTQSLAIKYFGKGNSAMGKTLKNNHGDTYKITGVVKDVPKNSHIIFNALISNSTLPKDFASSWGGFGFYTYVLLKPNADYKAFEKKLLPMYDKYMAPIFAKFNVKIHYSVQPILSIHLHSDLKQEPEELGSMSYIYIFSAVGLFMLIIACINYMNLTTARSARRAKEIGIRKVSGSFRSRLIAQFLIESVVIAFISLLLSIVLVFLLLPVFNSLSGKSISIPDLVRPGTFFLLFGVILFVGLLGGSYPAFYLSKFNPVTVLKGRLSKSSSNANLRRSLVVIQFAISMVMMICTAVVYRQLQFMRNKDLGFNKEGVISLKIDADGDFRGKLFALKNEIKKDPSVISVSTSNNIPGSSGVNFNLFSIETNKGFLDKGVDNYTVDADYLPTLGIKLISGRNFSSATPSDTINSIIVNENMVKTFGWGANALGKKLKFPGDTSGKYMQVIGVVKDFNQKSLYNPIAPLILFYYPGGNLVQVKAGFQNVPATLASIEKSWKTIFPELPFQYTFLDQDYNSQYAADQKRGKIFTTFSSLTIFITCLGLLGLIAFTTEQRQKEISLRKIMGADLLHIVTLIARNFVFLVVLSAFIAFPVAYYFMAKWLAVFPYNSGLSAAIFLYSALAVLLITLATVSFHTIKAAVGNPSKSLRTE
jgi:putative ABC transport system permease protein